MYHVYHSE